MKFLLQFFICGIFTSLLFPPFFLTPLGFFIIPYLLFLLSNSKFVEKNIYEYFISGFGFGFGFCFFYLGWIKQPFLLDIQTKNYFFFSYLLIFYCSLYFGIMFIIIKFLKKIEYVWLIFPALIVLIEFLCNNVGYGFPWISFALINSNNFIGTSLIYYVGTYGLSYLTILFFSFPFIFFFKSKKFKIKLLIFFIILILLITVLILNRNLKKPINEQLLKVTLVQMNYQSNQQLNTLGLNKKYKNILKEINQSDDNLIIFGENDYPYLMDTDNINIIQKNINSNSNLIIGSATKDQKKYYNSFFLINKKNYEKFNKKILVPFGEFIPFRYLFKFMESIAGSVDYSNGSDNRYIKINNHLSIIPVICYEIVYFWKLIDKYNSNADLIINITNDSWFGDFSGPYQHFYLTKLRAAEFNKPIIRLSNNGVSAIINNFGNIIENTSLNNNEVIKSSFYIFEDKNNYINFHKIYLLIIFLISFIIFLFGRYEKK